jgi:hypothetical protein
MTTRRKGKGLLNIDVLALSLLCCLLASVVGILVLAGDDGGEGETGHALTDIHQQVVQLAGQVQATERAREDMATKLNFAMLERDNRKLQTRITELGEKITLISQIAGTKKEVVRLGNELATLEAPANADLTPEMQHILGDYRGPYVLIECIEDGAIIYPSKQKIEMKPAKEQVDTLLKQITKAGFVVFVARPAGWYNNSYDNLRTLLTKELDKMKEQGGKHVGRSAFPLDRATPIDNYLPPEATP